MPKRPRRKTTMTRENNQQYVKKGERYQASKERVKEMMSGV
jgi:hypothetical protein